MGSFCIAKSDKSYVKRRETTEEVDQSCGTGADSTFYFIEKRLNDEEDSSNEDRSDGEIDNVQDGKSNNDSKPMAPLDIDGFTQFLLTGERPGSNSSTNTNSNSRKRKSKKVKFSDQVDVHDDSNYLTPMESPQPVSQNPLDYTLPMDQLLKQMQNNQQLQNPQEQEEEKEVLKDVDINNFQHLNSVDTVSVGGTPVPPSNFGNSDGQDGNLLKPNMTGPAQISKMFSSLQPDFKTNEPDLKPLRPNVTGPADMARLFTTSSPISTASATSATIVITTANTTATATTATAATATTRITQNISTGFYLPNDWSDHGKYVAEYIAKWETTSATP